MVLKFCLATMAMYELAITLKSQYDSCVFHVPLSDSGAKISLPSIDYWWAKHWLTKGKLTLKTLLRSSKILCTLSFFSFGRDFKIPQTKILMLQTNYCASATIITIFSNLQFNSFKIGLHRAFNDRYLSFMTQLKFFSSSNACFQLYIRGQYQKSQVVVPSKTYSFTISNLALGPSCTV